MDLWRWAMAGSAALLFMSAGLTVAMTRTPDPLGALCHDSVELLPATIPKVLVLNVSDERAQRLPREMEARVRDELAAALSHFPFNDSIVVVTNDSATLPPEAHIAQLHLHIHGPLPSRWFDTPQGRMCGNTLLVLDGPDSAYNIWSHKHELGHYFGLPHHEGTFMNGRGDRSVQSDIVAPCQREILNAWTAGEHYIAHWTRGNRGECALKPSRWDQWNPFS